MSVSTPYDNLHVSPNTPVKLGSRATKSDAIFADKARANISLKADQKRIGALQQLLYASAKNGVLIILQGMDTAGKSGTIRGVFARTSPQGVQVRAFKRPTDEELAHDYLWRAHKVMPKKGHITIFDRSHYEDVLVVKVREFTSAEEIEQRYHQINDFERMLTENGTIILKFMLHISYKTQGERLRARLVNPGKGWKFNPGDLDDRAIWPQYMDAYETMLHRCSTQHAPWYVIPSDSRTHRNATIAGIIRARLETLNLNWPTTPHRLEDYQDRI